MVGIFSPLRIYDFCDGIGYAKGNTCEYLSGVTCMNAVRPIAVKLDQDTRDRLKRLADAKDRSTHWMLREAVAQFVEREEKREAFRQAGLQAWQEYQATGKHVTHDEADAWLAKLEAGEEAAAPECHN
jgi:predicted transcriptional regulator